MRLLSQTCFPTWQSQTLELQFTAGDHEAAGGSVPAKDRPEDRFTLKRTEYKKLYLDAGNNALSWEPVEAESSFRYDGNDGVANFDIRFDEDIEITGYMKLRLWVEADGNDDMDIFVNIQKLDTKGEWLPITVLGEKHPGAWGKMRVSHRALDEELSTKFQPVQSHRKEEKLAQRKYFFWYDKQSKASIIRSLKKMRRNDLIKKLYPKG